MTTLLKSATIIDPSSDFHKRTVDVLLDGGTITQIAETILEPADQTIDLEDLHISPGWFDSSVSFGEPGYEERETIANGLVVAGKSGFTTIVLNPSTKPVIDTSSLVEAVTTKSKKHVVKLLVNGALTVQSHGKDLAEMYDMHQHGAVSFGDYKQAIENPNLLKIALQYAQNFGGLVQSFPQDNRIAGQGLVNEFHNSTKLGLKGIPNLAEELQVARDLFILEYTGGKLHIPTITTKKSVELIKEGKRKGLDVSCSVSIHHLILTDDTLEEFDSNYKVQPPLRTKKDTEALREGLRDGTIDMVTTDHQPIDIEHKKVEFDNAEYGTIGLENAYGSLQSIFTTEEAIDFLTRGKARFGVETGIVAEGSKIDLSLFTPKGTSTFEKANILSTSKNSAFIGEQTKGNVYGVLIDGVLIS